MPSISLYPPLEQIENSLFSISDDLLHKLAIKDKSLTKELCEAALADETTAIKVDVFREALSHPIEIESSEHQEVPMPGFIDELITSKVAAQLVDFGKIAQVGQLIVLEELTTPAGQRVNLYFSQSPFVLLESQDLNTKVWHGFMVASEIQYASYWDALLEPEDEPFDPALGMVQVWNPIQISIPNGKKVTCLGKLSPKRMQAIRALSAEYLLGDSTETKTKIGYIASRSTFHGYSIVTGTPLVDDDPRRAYQQIYHHVADLINAPVYQWLMQAQTTLHTDWLAQISTQIAQIWKEFTGEFPPISDHAVGVLGYAMSGVKGDKERHIELQDDLHLRLFSEDDTQFSVQVTYTGKSSIKIVVIDSGRKVQEIELSANQETPICTGLERGKDNRIEMRFLDGKTISLPLGN